MSHECFEVEITDQIAHIVLSRPAKRNSMTPAFWRELPQIVEDIDAGAKARVIVISSTGPHFCAGLDISGIGSGGESARPDPDARKREAIRHGASFYDNTRRLQDSLSALESCRLPVLAAIQGGLHRRRRRPDQRLRHALCDRGCLLHRLRDQHRHHR